MHVRDAVRVEIDNLVRGVDDARLLHGFRVAAELVHQGLEALRHEGARELDGAFYLFSVRDGHNAGENRAGDARLAELVQEVEEEVVVKDHLRGEEIGASFDFFLEVLDVFALGRTFRVLFRVAGRSDAEVSVAFLEFTNELDSVVVIKLVHVAFEDLWGEVAAEGHYILDAGGLHVFNASLDGFLATADASEVCEHREIEFFFEILCNLQGVLADSAASTIGDTHERRPQGCYGFGCSLDVFEAGFLFGWEHFEGQAHFVLLEDVDDFHRKAFMQIY